MQSFPHLALPSVFHTHNEEHTQSLIYSGNHIQMDIVSILFMYTQSMAVKGSMVHAYQSMKSGIIIENPLHCRLSGKRSASCDIISKNP